MLSHELRSPLAPIANAVELLGLQEGTETETLVHKKARSIIERQLGHLQHLVDDLLEVSRITTGRVQLHREPTAVSTIVEGAVETVRPLIEQRRHELTVSLPPKSIWLYADAVRLEQVVVNLLTNAAKYTEEGGQVWLTVEEERRTPVPGIRSQGLEVGRIDSSLTPAWVLIRVRDTGVGIASALLPHIFDLFTQAERTLDRSQGGLGIGLALVQRLVEMHGGTVEASSTLGQGSEFVVRLPVVAPPEVQPSPPPAERAESNGPSLRVLVVDDSVDTVTTLAMLVRESGHEVRTAYDGSAVLEAALDFRPNVVLLDIGLPGLNGFEVAKQLRQQPALQNAVLVAMTGYGQTRDRQRSQEAGFDHHLVKPGDFGKVLEILATVSMSRSR